MKLLHLGFCLVLALAVATPCLAVPTCSIATTASLDFGVVVPLASTGDISSNTGASLWVNCSADVANAPAIYATATRAMVSGGNQLPFRLSTQSPGGAELPYSSPGDALGIDRDGTDQTVTLHGRILVEDFKALPSGQYTQVLSLTVEY